jgi:hypothetical protein
MKMAAKGRSEPHSGVCGVVGAVHPPLVAVHGGNVASGFDFLADVAEFRGGFDTTAVRYTVHPTEHLGARHGFVVGTTAVDALEDTLGVHVNEGDGGVRSLHDGGFPAAALEDTDDIFGGERGILLGSGGRKGRAHFKALPPSRKHVTL